VPLVVVSPYAKPGYISNQEYDFGSIVKAIEGIFGLGSLGFADARAANDLHDFFNFNQAATSYKTIPAPLAGSFFTKNKEVERDPPDSD
jgi:phospholipase C